MFGFTEGDIKMFDRNEIFEAFRSALLAKC